MNPSAFSGQFDAIAARHAGHGQFRVNDVTYGAGEVIRGASKQVWLYVLSGSSPATVMAVLTLAACVGSARSMRALKKLGADDTVTLSGKNLRTLAQLSGSHECVELTESWALLSQQEFAEQVALAAAPSKNEILARSGTVKTGPFAGSEAKAPPPDGSGRVRAKVQMFGHWMELELPEEDFEVGD